MILFIDIETVPEYSNIKELPNNFLKHWEHKMQFLRLREEEKDAIEKAYRNHAGIFAEWAKIVSIGLGYFDFNNREFKSKGITSHDEKQILIDLKQILSDFRNLDSIQFCGHNIREFDLPFLCRRYIINKMSLPDELQLAGLKPWENNHIDTMNLWKFGEYKRFTSLDLLATCLGIESPKVDIDGSQVAQVYYEEKDLDKIERYCLRDVKTTAKVYFRLTGQSVEF